MEEINIKEYLNTFSNDESVYYIPNPGYGGDMLIACATFQLFNDLKIRYHVVNGEAFDSKDKVVFYGGGGNLVPYYNYARKIIERNHQHAKRIVILPHTISDNEDFLLGMGKNVDIICREQISFDHVQRFAHQAQVMLSSDMAFNLKVQDVLSEDADTLGQARFLETVYLFKKSQRHIPKLKQFNHFLKREAELFKLSNDNNKSLLRCFRADVEKTDINLPAGNIDVSGILAYGKTKETLDYATVLLVTNQMLRFINRYTKIETNRLHVAIAAALLGKDVALYRNSYYKNEAVYKYSLEKQFSNVRWMG
jgi:exopolysaccharide biosynthesis predicted pyruvyltransferase EpsI